MPTASLPLIAEDSVPTELRDLYDEIKREMQLPYVPNMMKALAVSPAALTIFWDFLRSFYRHISLPQSLIAMIFYTIATSSECRYCSAGSEVTCRTLGVDDETLEALVADLGNVSPARLQAIIAFTLKVAKDPKSLEADDYRQLREQGVSDAEIVELILVAGAGVYGDILADALKIDVEADVTAELDRFRASQGSHPQPGA